MQTLKRALLGALLFGLLGPPIGGLLVGLGLWAVSGFDPYALLGLIVFVLMAYFFGGPSALLTGVAAGLLRPYLQRKVGVPVLTLLGTGLTVLYQLCIFSRGQLSWDDWGGALMFSVPAIPVTAGLAWYFLRPSNPPTESAVTVAPASPD